MARKKVLPQRVDKSRESGGARSKKSVNFSTGAPLKNHFESTY